MLLPILASTILTLLIGLILAITARLRSILPANRLRPTQRRSPLSARQSTANAAKVSHVRNRSRRIDRASRDVSDPKEAAYPYQHVMIVLGSGGHTAEMLLMLRVKEHGSSVGLENWKRRTWVVSSGDGFSADLAREFEEDLRQGDPKSDEPVAGYEIWELPRARKVHQSILSAPWTSLLCLWAAMKMLYRSPPDIIVSNGPGTGVIVVLASLVLRFLGVQDSERTRCIYVESLARCRTLSLSGRLLKGVADRFLVQWAELADSTERGRGVEFCGCFTLDAASRVGLNGVNHVSELRQAENIIQFDV